MTVNVLRRTFKLLIDFFLPRRCVVCNSRLHEGEQIVCSRCLIENAMNGVFDDSNDNAMLRGVLGCGEIVRANALFHFHPKSEMARLIYKMKYQGRWGIGIYMGRHAAKVFQPQGFFDGVDVVIPVPLTRKRRRQRGYNQSEMIAEGLSDMTGIAIDKKSLKRRHFTESQAHMGKDQRQENVADAFVVEDASKLDNKHILLIDDIFTTGATLSACIREISSKAVGTRLSILTLGLTKS